MSLAYRHFGEIQEDQPFLHSIPPLLTPDKSFPGPSNLPIVYPAFIDLPDDLTPSPYHDMVKLVPTTPMMSLHYDKPPLRFVFDITLIGERPDMTVFQRSSRTCAYYTTGAICSSSTRVSPRYRQPSRNKYANSELQHSSPTSAAIGKSIRLAHPESS
jgi:hypothetical protein